MFLCEILTEQQQVLPAAPQVQPQSAVPTQSEVEDEYDPELDGSVEEVAPFQEILPMKRYYLIGKLKELKSRLDQNNIQNTDFDIILKFTNSLSYSSLLSLTSGIIPVVEEQLTRLTTNA